MAIAKGDRMTSWCDKMIICLLLQTASNINNLMIMTMVIMFLTMWSRCEEWSGAGRVTGWSHRSRQVDSSITWGIKIIIFVIQFLPRAKACGQLVPFDVVIAEPCKTTLASMQNGRWHWMTFLYCLNAIMCRGELWGHWAFPRECYTGIKSWVRIPVDLSIIKMVTIIERAPGSFMSFVIWWSTRHHVIMVLQGWSPLLRVPLAVGRYSL